MLQTQVSANETQALLFSRVARVAHDLVDSIKFHSRLLVGVIVAAVIVALVALHFTKPVYTAVAVVGPSNGTLNESTSALESALGGIRRGGVASLARGAFGSNPTFSQFNKILQSNRLAAVMASDEEVMRTIYAERYDWERHRWKPRKGIVSYITGGLKEFLHLPVKSQPDADDVRKYLSVNVSVDTPLTSEFTTITLKSRDPQTAEWLLNKILYKADTLIRDDRHRDVAARIAYLQSVLPTISQNDGRQTLIFILNDQLHSMMTVAADKRYASNLVDPPHASRIPTSPSPTGIIGISIVAGIAIWFLIVRYMHGGIEWIKRAGGRGKAK